MTGAVIIVVVLCVVIPVAVLISGGVAAAVLGYFLKTDADASNEGSELLKTNV